MTTRENKPVRQRKIEQRMKHEQQMKDDAARAARKKARLNAVVVKVGR